MDWRNWAIAAIALLIAFNAVVNLTSLGVHRTAPAAYKVGDDVDVSITLVSTDARALACASRDEFAGRHCEFETTTGRWTHASDGGLTGPQATLAPYKTSDDVLLLVGGLFSEPALQKRLSIDPPTMGPEHSRFLAHCKMHIEGNVPKLDVRWQLSGQWFPATNGWTGTVSGCTISDP